MPSPLKQQAAKDLKKLQEIGLPPTHVFPVKGKKALVKWTTSDFDESKWAYADGYGLAVPLGISILDLDTEEAVANFKASGLVSLAHQDTPRGQHHIFPTPITYTYKGRVMALIGVVVAKAT